MTALPASHAARRISAPAPTQFLPCLLRRKPVWQSRKSKWCSAIQSFRLARFQVVRGQPHRWFPLSLPRRIMQSIRYCRSRPTTPGSPFENRKPDDLAFEGGRVFVKADGPGGGVPFADLLKRADLRLVTGSGRSEGIFGSKAKPKFSMHSLRLSLCRSNMAT